MDALSEAIAAIRLGTANAKRVKEHGAWGTRFPAYTGSGFHIVLDGEGWLLTHDSPPRQVRPGDVIVVPTGAEHGLSRSIRPLHELPDAQIGPSDLAPGPADFEYLCGGYRLAYGPVHHYFASLPGVIAISPDYDHDPQLHELTGLLATNTTPAPSAPSTPAQSGASATRSALFDLLLIHILRQWQARPSGPGPSPAAPHEPAPAPEWAHIADPAIAGVLHAVHADPRRPWTVGELSAYAGISRTAFTRRFTAQMGTAPRTYLTSQRLLHGARLLRATSAPLSMIAHQVGYSTEFAFGAAFRREFGISPGRFRATA